MYQPSGVMGGPPLGGEVKRDDYAADDSDGDADDPDPPVDAVTTVKIGSDGGPHGVGLFIRGMAIVTPTPTRGAPMFVVHGTFPVLASAADDVRAAIAGLQAATRAESGNLSYEWAESVESPNTFFSIETWESRQAVDDHLGTEHVKAAVARLPGWLAGAPSLVGYETPQEITLPL